MPKISVIITAHNYGRYLRQAIDSVLKQTFADFELMVVNDGSTDNTPQVIASYLHEPRLKTLNLEGVGLAKASNIGIKNSSGEYIIRLDADDYFDENILTVLNGVLDHHADYGMVFPDYYRVDKYGKIIDQIRQPKINDEVTLLDRSALAAGALYRRKCYDKIGGYDEELKYQEDYDFWIRFIDSFHVYNVQLPLMYYRQHSASMSKNIRARMEARQYVKHKFVNEHRNLNGKRTICVLPIVMENRYRYGLPLEIVGNKPLMSYAIEEAKKADFFERIIVDTENAQIAELAIKLGVEAPYLRPRELASLDILPTDHLKHLSKSLKDDGYEPDIILVSAYNHPFIKSSHMREAIETIQIYNCDSVVSVKPNIRYQWKQGEHGLEPINYQRTELTDQKDVIYEERGGIYAFNAQNLEQKTFLGKSVSFIEVEEFNSLRIDSDFKKWIATEAIKHNLDRI